MNRDHLQMFPDQLIDGDPQECVALSVADIKGNIDSQLYDPDYTYAMTLKLMGVGPTTSGLDPYSGMLSAIVYGTLPITLESFTAKTMGELYIANFLNYTQAQRTFAQSKAMNGVTSLFSYNDICNWLGTEKSGVSLAIRWYESFNTPNADGTLPAPAGGFTYHNVAVYDDQLKGLMIKPWLGPTFGAGGYAFMSSTTFDLVFQSAAAFNPDAWRWFSLAQIAVTHPAIISDILPQLHG